MVIVVVGKIVLADSNPPEVIFDHRDSSEMRKVLFIAFRKIHLDLYKFEATKKYYLEKICLFFYLECPKNCLESSEVCTGGHLSHQHVLFQTPVSWISVFFQYGEFSLKLFYKCLACIS